MFEAYSQSKDAIVNVKSEFDLNEVFLCPNPQCGAKFVLRSVNGKMAKHFARLRSSLHCNGCPYDKSHQSYINNDHMVKYKLEDIYNSMSHRQTKDILATQEISDRHLLAETERKFIRTPKQLYYFCVNNALDTPYTDSLTVGDIVLDSRNLQHNANFEGISGLRLIIAETIQFNMTDNYIKFKVCQRTVHNRFLKLNITVYFNHNLLTSVISYIMKTHGRFGGYYVAILGNWSIDEKYYISCTIKSKDHLMLKLS